MSIVSAIEMWSPFSLSKVNYSRKVFVGGLPIDMDPEVVEKAFGKFGDLYLDWPRMSEIRRERQVGTKLSSSRNVTGYVFIIYQREKSVVDLLTQCYCEDNKYYMLLSSPTMHEKPVQVRPWCLSDIDYMPRPSVFLDPRRTIFIGGVPRPTRACELAFVLESNFGPVSYVGVDIDPELKYPKGAARVTFNTTKSFVAAINGRFVNIPHADANKRVEIKPYVMDDQMCDNCHGKLCADRYAPYFCGDVSCLQYYCEVCWDLVHFNDFSVKKRATHRPFIRMGDQTRLLPNIPHHNSSVSHLNGFTSAIAGAAAGIGGIGGGGMSVMGIRGAAATSATSSASGIAAASALAGASTFFR